MFQAKNLCGFGELLVLKFVFTFLPNLIITMEQKGMIFDHDFYVVVGKQCCTENVYAGHQHNIYLN